MTEKKLIWHSLNEEIDEFYIDKTYLHCFERLKELESL